MAFNSDLYIIDGHTKMCWNNSEENKRKHKSINKANKAVSNAMREKAEEAHAEVKNCPNECLG